MVYSADDSGRKNPLFLLVNDAVRDPKNSVNGKGLFSCGNERGNVYVSQRPSADFRVDDPIKMGCYVIANNVKDSDITNRGFIFQDDLTEASISGNRIIAAVAGFIRGRTNQKLTEYSH